MFTKFALVLAIVTSNASAEDAYRCIEGGKTIIQNAPCGSPATPRPAQDKGRPDYAAIVQCGVEEGIKRLGQTVITGQPGPIKDCSKATNRR